MTEIPARRMTIAARSDVGRRRKLNEDSHCLDAGLGLMAVADGMGGHDKGEVASRLAAEALLAQLRANAAAVDAGGRDSFRRQLDLLRDAVRAANRRVYDENAAQGYPEGAGMGTTLVGAWLLNPSDHIGIFNVGDSRLYRWRDGGLRQLTRDHTLYQEWLENGRQGAAPRRNIILRALGPWPEIEADLFLERVYSGDVYLACSDGLTGMLDDAEIAGVLAGLDAGAGLEQACETLVTKANEAGGDDNVTVVLARCA